MIFKKNFQCVFIAEILLGKLESSLKNQTNKNDKEIALK